MEVQRTTNPDGSVHEHYSAAPGETVVMTGPVTGVMTLEDGTTVNVTPAFVAVADQAQADELSHAIALRHVEQGNPNDVDELVDPETGQTVAVQRPFVYEAPDGEVLVGTGIPHGEHPLDEANEIYPSDADPRIAAVAQSKES